MSRRSSRARHRIGMTTAAALLAAAGAAGGHTAALSHSGAFINPEDELARQRILLPARATDPATRKLVPRLDSANEFAFRYDGILGTSLDLLIRGGSASAAHAAVRATLTEVDRLSAMLSTRNPASEISRMMGTSGAQPCSPEIGALLDQYQRWSDLTDGVISCQLQPLLALWSRAAADGALPSDESVARAVAAARQPGWSCDAHGQMSFGTRDGINVDALGKAFIVDRALAAAVRAAPEAAGILLDVGGDIAVSGGPWNVGVADPSSPADNAQPLTCVTLQNQSIATSAGYERCFTIDGRSFSHILDSRTGRPANAAASSTAIASDAVTANALALALCILGPHDGASLVSRHDAAAIVVDNEGTMHRLGHFAELVIPAPSPLYSGERVGVRGQTVNARPVSSLNQPALSLGDRAAGADSPRGMANAPAAAWPADYQVSIALSLKQHPGRRSHRPYVAVWIEDANHKPVRTITVWGNDAKYQRDLGRWWKIAAQNPKAMAAVTRATRQPGKYTVTWDGLDDAGKPLPAGKYTVFVEINREHGTHATSSAVIPCGGAAAASAKADETEEADAIVVDYAKKGAK